MFGFLSYLLKKIFNYHFENLPATIAIVEHEKAPFGILIKKAVVVGMLATVISLLADWGLTRAMYGNELAGFSAKHIRFGPDATATTEKTGSRSASSITLTND